jgi:hypothetical protein
MMLAPQTATSRGNSLAVKGQLLPFELSCFLKGAEPCSRLQHVWWCHYGDVWVASEGFGSLPSPPCATPSQFLDVLPP